MQKNHKSLEATAKSGSVVPQKKKKKLHEREMGG